METLTALPSPSWEPDWASPPGDTLIEALQERGWTQAHLARATGFSQKHINQIVKGKASVGVGLAVELEKLGVGSARFWLHREADYRLALYRQTVNGTLACP